MRTVTPATDAAWRSETKVGPTRPVVRATIQRIFMGAHPYNTEDAPGGDYDHHRQRTGFYRSVIFGSGGAPREVPYVRKMEWARSVDQDVASGTLTVQNTHLIAMGSPESADYPEDFELPGYLTWNRGLDPVAAERWGYGTPSFYGKFFMPDRMVRTYEGYGADFDLAPGDDENLYISGTWLIDDVTYDANGDIVIAMRDLGRMLLDHISFPPIVPYADYPMTWSKIRTESVTGRAATGGNWAKPKATATSSNNLYTSRSIDDVPRYVQSSGAVQGHGNRDPLSSTTDDYWLSTGQVSQEGFVWWEEEFANPQNIAALRIRTLGGPYKIFVSLYNDETGKWYGRRTIPYRFGSMDGNEAGSDDATGEVSGLDIGADIPFVDSETAERGQSFDLVLRKKYRNVSKVRITMTRLRNMTAVKYPWRAGLRSVSVYRGAFSELGFGQGPVSSPMGNYRDFTDVIRWVASWCGWWWPEDDDRNWQNFRDTHDPADRVHYDYDSPDPALVKGRVWGTLQNTGTAGIADLTADQFDKQPLMNVIAKVREIVGFQFMIDEAGGIVWRRPNLDSKGNYVTRDHKSTRRAPTRVEEYVTIDEEETLLTYQTKHSSRNLRERIFVGSTNGHIGAVVKGYTPLPKTGFRRVAGWLDENWKNKRQALVAGDLIAARQMFDYRRSRFTIPGNPALQVDDQFRIFERTTNETYFHYMIGISSALDMENGTWDYTCESHWLGPDIDQAFVLDASQLDPATQNYLQAVGGEN